MAKWAIVLAVAAVGATGCTQSYTVHVDAFAEPDRPVTQGASIYVVADPNVGNPILRRQVAAKIGELLRGYGYGVAETREAAKYLLTFEMGLSSDQVVDYVPMYRPFGGFYGGYYGWRHGHMGFGYSTYVPYIDTVFVHWFRMKVLTKDGATINQANVIWLGEALLGSDSPDLRRAISYLLVACMDHFGQDTGRWITEIVRVDDPRIVGMEEESAEETR
jgi:hypothetical protein